MGTKSLFLLRHAKAVTGGILISDKDRALSEKGVKDVTKLAHKLSKKELSFDQILMSPSVRTITTGQIISNGLRISHSHLVVNDSLYGADIKELLKSISLVSKKIDGLMIIGHNPGLMELASFIAGEPIFMSTCALIKFSFNFKNWEEILTQKADKFSVLN
jgi:phosphohistidine phosphatase